MGLPPRVSPPRLSAIKGWVNAPPPASAKLLASIFGKDASCPDINRALSEKPAVKELPMDT